MTSGCSSTCPRRHSLGSAPVRTAACSRDSAEPSAVLVTSPAGGVATAGAGPGEGAAAIKDPAAEVSDQGLAGPVPGGPASRVSNLAARSARLHAGSVPVPSGHPHHSAYGDPSTARPTEPLWTS